MDALNQVNEIRSSRKAELMYLPTQYLEYCLAMQSGAVMPWIVDKDGVTKVVMSAIVSIEAESATGRCWNITLQSGDTVFRRTSGLSTDW